MPAVSSPCIKVCVIDPVSGLCRGCLRDLDEIAAWGVMGEPARRRVMENLPGRRTRLSGAGEGSAA